MCRIKIIAIYLMVLMASGGGVQAQADQSLDVAPVRAVPDSDRNAIVQISFNHTWSDEVLHERAKEFALNIKSGIPGLVWKIFLKQDKERGSSGIYLFDSMESAQSYVNGERVAGMYKSADLSNITVRVSDVMTAESILAAAPL